MPIADKRPPMVVGMRQTRSDTSTKTVCGAFEYAKREGCKVTTASRKTM